jgi:hypothetical protein
MAAPQAGRCAIWVNPATFKAVQELADFAALDVEAFVEFVVKELHDNILADAFVALIASETHHRAEARRPPTIHGPAAVIPINRERRRRPERRSG